MSTSDHNNARNRLSRTVGPLAMGAICAGLAASFSRYKWVAGFAGAVAGALGAALAIRVLPPAPHGNAEASANDQDATKEEALPSSCAPEAETSPVSSDGAAKQDDALREQTDEPPRPTAPFDYDAFAERILLTNDPIAELKLIVGAIRTQQARDEAVLGLEAFLARQLEEAGLFEKDADLPTLKIVMPTRSKMFYLRIQDPQMTYLAKLRVLRIEAALNAVRFAHTYFAHPEEQQMEDFYRLLTDLQCSICGQTLPIDTPFELQEGDNPDGEWAVRHSISEAAEALQLPYRLSFDYRVNVADGNVAIEVDLMPENAWATHMYIDGLGIVPCTHDMRRKAASGYALRVALILANIAFRSSKKIKHVWIAGCIETASRRWCYLTVDFDRWRFSKLDLTQLGNLQGVYHSFVPTMRLEEGILKPVEQSFSLSEARFCPPKRYEAVSLSTRRIPKSQASVLGANHVCGLAIEEADKRMALAADIARKLVVDDDARATEKNVRMVLDLAGDDPDPSVRQAAERLVERMVRGEIPLEPDAVTLEFVAGDTLSKAALDAHELLPQKNYSAVVTTLRHALRDIDLRGDYDDAPSVEWRYFGNYVDRALYNNLYAAEGVSVMLVPDTYFEGHLLLSAALLGQHRNAEALAHARRALAIAPLDKRAHLHLIHCLEEAGHHDDALSELKTFISRAHDPQALGLGFYHMASLQQQEGHLVAAEACYLCTLNVMPNLLPMVGMELAALAAQHPGTFHESMASDEILAILRDHGIPAGPSHEMVSAFHDCARATLDAEVFPAARNFLGLLGAFSGDDVILGMLRSLEAEPDL